MGKIKNKKMNIIREFTEFWGGNWEESKDMKLKKFKIARKKNREMNLSAEAE